MNEEQTNIQKIKEVLKKGRLSKTQLCKRTGIHPYLIDKYIEVLLKNYIIEEEKNSSGKYVYYKLNIQRKRRRTETL